MTGRDSSRGWLIATSGAVVAAGLVLSLFRVPAPPVRVEQRPAPIALKPPEDREEADLYDPTPLFLPTRWNTRPNADQAEGSLEPAGQFRDYAPKLTPVENAGRPDFPAVVATPAVPLDAVATAPSAVPFAGFGRSEVAIAALPSREAFVEVASAATGAAVISQPFVGAHPPGDSDWEPLEFLAAVEPGGLVGLPVLTRSSRVEQVDTYFQNYLAKAFRLGGRLGPGFYRIKIGP
jgi:hypothetical protein